MDMMPTFVQGVPNVRLRATATRLREYFDTQNAERPGSIADKVHNLIRTWPGHLIHGKDYIQIGDIGREGRGTQGMVWSSSDRENSIRVSVVQSLPPVL